MPAYFRRSLLKGDKTLSLSHLCPLSYHTSIQWRPASSLFNKEYKDFYSGVLNGKTTHAAIDIEHAFRQEVAKHTLLEIRSIEF